jgi:hypothetical protein
MLEDDSADLAAKPMYSNGLLDNTDATQDHLARKDDTPFPPSFLPPNGVPKEKDVFLYAL